MNDNVRLSAPRVLQWSISNDSWLNIGYGKRPKYGAIFRRFRPKWRVDIEDSILREMVSIFTAAHVLAGILEVNNLDEIIDIYVDGFGSATGLFHTFGFLSRKDALTHFDEAIREYTEAEPSQWPEILTRRLKITRIPDRKLSAKLMVGSIRFAMGAQDMALLLKG